MRVFVPVEDASFDARIGALVPYRCGLTCEHALHRESPALASGEGVWWWIEPQAQASPGGFDVSVRSAG